jgi:hypothetical protein
MGTSKGPNTESAWYAATYDAVLFIALLATALALGGALAHAFEFPNKIGLTGEEYFVVQKVYRGWNQLAYVLLAQVIAMSAAAVMARHEPVVRGLAVLALLYLLGAQAVFWIYTYPANVETQNWTAMPGNWEGLRRQWEYSHLAGAAFQLLAMVCLIIAALARGRSTSRR